VTIEPGRLVLLDTSVVVHLARNDGTGRRIEKDFALTSRVERPLISTVAEGEVLGLARYRNWGQEKVARLQRLLAELVRVEAGMREIVDLYAELYAEGRRNGQSCGQNDLWIAATAKATDAVLLTSDKDFDWLHNKHITRHLIGPPE
jgi:tRNA(fMet)-specific endonuclease VapC